MFAAIYEEKQIEVKAAPEQPKYNKYNQELTMDAALKRFHENTDEYIHRLLTQQSFPSSNPEKPTFTDLGLCFALTLDRWNDAGSHFLGWRNEKQAPALIKKIFGKDYEENSDECLFRPQALCLHQDLSKRISKVLKEKHHGVLGFFNKAVAAHPHLEMTTEGAVRIVRYTLQMMAAYQYYYGLQWELSQGTVRKPIKDAIHISFSEALCDLLSAYTGHMYKMKAICENNLNRRTRSGSFMPENYMETHCLPTILDCIPVLASFVKRYSSLSPAEALPHKDQLVVVMESLQAIDEMCQPCNRKLWDFLPIYDNPDKENTFLRVFLEWFYANGTRHHIGLLTEEHENYANVVPGVVPQIMQNDLNFGRQVAMHILQDDADAALLEKEAVPADILFFATTLRDHVFTEAPWILQGKNCHHLKTWTAITGLRLVRGQQAPVRAYPCIIRFTTRMRFSDGAPEEIPFESAYEERLLRNEQGLGVLQMVREEEDIQLTDLSLEYSPYGPPSFVPPKAAPAAQAPPKAPPKAAPKAPPKKQQKHHKPRSYSQAARSKA